MVEGVDYHNKFGVLQAFKGYGPEMLYILHNDKLSCPNIIGTRVEKHWSLLNLLVHQKPFNVRKAMDPLPRKCR